jgi:HEAT repeat protein
MIRTSVRQLATEHTELTACVSGWHPWLDFSVRSVVEHFVLRVSTVGRSPRTLALAVSLLVASASLLEATQAQEPAAPQAVSAEALQTAIDKLGDLDYTTRTNASRTVRRTAPTQVVPALLRAVAEHADGFVRYRALVLLTGFNDPRTKDAMRESLASPNDRLRTVAYSYFEHNPDRGMIPDLLASLGREQAEFVRPALTRALAALGDEPRVRQTLLREAMRGEDFFRSAVIEALGDYKAVYAFETLTGIAKLDGPLLDDTAIALGKIGDKRALETLAGLQRTAPKSAQPLVAASICLLGVNCESHENYLAETLKFSDQNIGFQELLRGAASGLGALGVAGRASAVTTLFDVGIPSQDPTRAPVALAVGMVALRNTPLMIATLESHPRRSDAIALLGEGFDMLEEDLDKERFFALVRRTYWASAEGSPARELMQTLIGKLNF